MPTSTYYTNDNSYNSNGSYADKNNPSGQSNRNTTNNPANRTVIATRMIDSIRQETIYSDGTVSVDVINKGNFNSTGVDNRPSSTNTKPVDRQSDYISQDDGGTSARLLNRSDSISIDRDLNFHEAPEGDVTLMKHIMHSANQYTNSEIKNRLYTQTFRFGLRDTYGVLGSAREYLFFTKPDLHIFQADDNNRNVDTSLLNNGLKSIPFWSELATYRSETTLKSLQLARDTNDPFNHLLQNMVKSNLDVPGLTSETIDTPTNMYGVGYSYRGSSEASDDNPTFSLEFKDNRFLDVFTFFKAYEEYETLKHHGVVEPQMPYIMNKIIHDQFSIYKFIVADDMETIIYYGKMYGVMPVSLPRDVFSNPQFDDGISFTVDFKAAFYEDMKIDILADFNELGSALYNAQKYQINPYNFVSDKADMRTAKVAVVVKDKYSALAKQSPTGYVYKLKWRGSEVI